MTTPIVFVFTTFMYKDASNIQSDGVIENRREVGFAAGLTSIGIFILWWVHGSLCNRTCLRRSDHLKNTIS